MFETSPAGVGRAGGVVLITAAAAENLVLVKYAYTDIDILSALWLGLVGCPIPQRSRLQRLRIELEADPRGEVEVPRSAFLAVPGPEQLLAIAGLHSRYKPRGGYSSVSC